MTSQHHINSTTIESPETHKEVEIPLCYHEFLDVFSKAKAMGLRPHWEYDCRIEILPNKQQPLGRIYSLSIEENKAMEEYIQEALQ